ncbi:MAG: DUF367 family protein [Candidatus Thermoplasmatota archaeon]|nr:DUF367 family protein [Candidatus Thermoplasmatota archaeon]
MKKPIRLFVYHTAEDDPKKCSAKKMQRFGHVKLENNLRRLPRGMILLNPLSEKSLSKEDERLAETKGILALDCSWKTIEKQFPYIEEKYVSRALPFVLAVNPVNYGKANKLSTLEAFVAALYILDRTEQAEEILKLYKWGPQFIELNREPLEDYRTAKTSKELIERMNQYISD